MLPTGRRFDHDAVEVRVQIRRALRSRDRPQCEGWVDRDRIELRLFIPVDFTGFPVDIWDGADRPDAMLPLTADNPHAGLPQSTLALRILPIEEGIDTIVVSNARAFRLETSTTLIWLRKAEAELGRQRTRSLDGIDAANQQFPDGT